MRIRTVRTRFGCQRDREVTTSRKSLPLSSQYKLTLADSNAHARSRKASTENRSMRCKAFASGDLLFTAMRTIRFPEQGAKIVRQRLALAFTGKNDTSACNLYIYI